MFPSVVKAGFGLGGEYGEGAVLVSGQTAGYYNSVSASIGFQLGVQERSVIIAFLTPQALAQFRQTAGWKIGADASVAIITIGIGGSNDTNKITSPVVGFILDPKGLMYNLTLEGSRSRASIPEVGPDRCTICRAFPRSALSPLWVKSRPRAVGSALTTRRRHGRSNASAAGRYRPIWPPAEPRPGPFQKPAPRSGGCARGRHRTPVPGLQVSPRLQPGGAPGISAVRGR